MGFQQAWDGFNRFRDAAESGEGIEGGVARAVCDAYAGQPAVVNAATNATNPAFGAVAREGCKPYWDGPEGYDAPTAPSEESPFEGGQCINVAYDVSVAWSFPGEPAQSFTNTFTGPIGLDVGSEDLGGGSTRYFGAIVFRAGQFNEGRSFAYQTNAEPENALSITGVARVDGNTDDCGNPDPVFVPSQPGSPPAGTGFGNPRDVGPPGSPFVVTPRLPELGPDGPYFPVDTPVGVEPYDPTNPDARPKSDPPSVGPPIDVDGAGEVDVDPEDEDVKPTLLGYRFEVRDNSPQFQSVIPGTSPRVYSRVVGSVQLVLRGENGTFYSDNLQVTSQEGSIVKSHPALDVVGCVYNVLPSLEGLTLYEIRGKDNDG